MTAEEFLTEEEESRIIKAIQKAELDTSGEIRVHLESNIEKPSMQHAQEVFYQIGMQKTKAKNGVLFYVDVANNIFTILGDKGINETVPDDFWDSIKNNMIQAFKQEQYAEGLVNGILEVGNKLKQYFPYQTDDVNELSDEISKSK
jgi:uncharacterized membrane protein